MTSRFFQGLLRRHSKFASFVALTAPLLASATQVLAQNADKAPPVAEITPLQSILLGLVQGLTEFIPVSSSGHLNLAHALMNHGRQLDYDVILSIGTLVALGWYFRHDWKILLTQKSSAKLRNLVFLSCVPAVIVGLSIRHLEEKPPFSDPVFNGLCMVVAALVLFWADRAGRQTRSIESVNGRDALLVGLSQAVALVPGVSRSGATLTAGLFLGLQREDAARFSFLMSLPISTGVVFKSLYDLYKSGAAGLNASPLSLVLGVGFSALSGFWAIAFLLNFLKTRDVTPFVVWRVVVGLAAMAYFYSLKK